MRRSLHHLRKEYQHYEVSFYVPNPTFKGLMRFRQSRLFSSSLKKKKGGNAPVGCVNNCFLVVVVVVVVVFAVAFLSCLNFLTRRCKRYL